MKQNEFSNEAAKNMRGELDDFNKTLLRLNSLISRIRNDQLRALASCKNALCLSCGRGDVNFIPPLEYVKGLDGQFYKADPMRDSHCYDKAQDVFTKQENCKEHTIHSHIPVDTLLQTDMDVIMKAKASRKSAQGPLRPQTTGASSKPL